VAEIMKYFFAISLILGSLTGPSFAGGQTKSFLNDGETQALIHEIDTVCGDTWCAGDLNYRFDGLVCHEAECYLDIQVITRNEGGANQSRPFRCELKGFQSAQDLLRVEAGFDGQKRYTYTDKLYDAVGQCLNVDVPQKYSVVYLPQASACRDSLRRKPQYTSAAHSVYAEIFYELEDKAQAAAQVLNEMVERYAAKDGNCSLQYHMAFADEISCERVGGQREICSLPTDLGRFIVLRDWVDSAAVLYIENAAQEASLGTLEADVLPVKLARAENCYTELLNLDGKQDDQMPFAAMDHRSYFVSAKGLNLSRDARFNAAELVNRVVSTVARKSGSCQMTTDVMDVSKNACTRLGEVELCVLGGRTAGYFVVARDEAGGAFVTFVRFD
jgi:hypothetical protein